MLKSSYRRRWEGDENQIDPRLLVDLMIEFEYRAQREVDEANKQVDDAQRYQRNTNRYLEAIEEIVKKHPEVQKEWEVKKKEIRGW